MPGLSLMEALASVPDPRKPRGLRHPLTAILGLTAVAVLAGMKSLEAIAQFGRDRGPALAHALGFRRGKTPAKSTLSEIFRLLDVDAFEGALRRWLQDRAGDAGDELAVDGKTLRGSADGEVPGVHLLAAYAPGADAVLAQLRVDAKTNEHKAALQLLGILPLKGAIVTGDALFCQRDLCAQIIEKGGDYLFFAKDNQPGLATDVAAGFGYEAAARSIAAAFSP